MRLVREADELRDLAGARIGFVPTMGAFHEGHLSLMREAKANQGFAVVSLFVNPTQFGPDEDFSRYPRDEAADAEMARSAGVDVLFAPSVEEVFPSRTTNVVVSGVSERWEGEHRPGHFDGVATVVAKLFHMVHPTDAYFGLKDLQQCAVVRRMVEDLNMRVRLHFRPTVREQDGLAMSSRNRYLSPEERRIAPMLNRSLRSASGAIVATGSSESAVEETLRESSAHLSRSGFEVGYFSMVDCRTFLPQRAATQHSYLVAAAKLGSVRLLDNCCVAQSSAVDLS